MQIRNEYPRPQFKRNNYLNLNGEWGFDFDDENKLLINNLPSFKNLNKTINVPFAYQCKASGINDHNFHEILWYEKHFDLSDDLKNKNILLNFNAVDDEVMVFLNDIYIGYHKGGYTAFSFDITPYVKDTNNHLVIRVVDKYDPTNPRGKQYWEKDVSRCWYYPTSGIWQSVWIEAFSKDYIVSSLLTPNIDENTITIETETAYKTASDIKIEISYKGKLVNRTISSIQNNHSLINIKIQEEDYIDEIHYWTIKNPNLYDVKLTLLKDNDILDEVETYFGFRKIHRDSLGNIYLNNKKIYQRLILDQGYFEDSDLTPPSIEALKNDILLSKEMGFNGARKHQKIEDPYFYYYADKLGFLVWAELPSAYNFNHHEIRNITSLAQDVIRQLYNHPSIITWVPFNESWGIRKALTSNKHQSLIRSTYHLIKALDNTRLIDSNDGWEQVSDTDFIAIHDYSPTGDNFHEKYIKENIENVQPMGRRLMAFNEKFLNHPILLTEYGGLSLQKDVKENFFGYHVSQSEEKFLNDLKHLQDNVRKCSFNGFCYTQLTDVKQETNGLLDAYHVPKFKIEEIRKIILENYEGQDFFD